MKGHSLRLLVVVTHIICGSVAALAFQKPAGDQLADFDARVARRGDTLATPNEQQAAIATLRSQLPKVRVDLDQITGAPRMISLADGFLTGSSGQGRAVTLGATAAIAVNDPNQPVKNFLDEHRELFGHGAEALNQTRFTRDYVTPHNGMRTVAWQQEVDGIPVFEAVLVAHTTKHGELVNISSGFVPQPESAANAGTSNRSVVVANPPFSSRAAVAVAARNVGETTTDGEVEAVGEISGGAEQKLLFQVPSLSGETVASLTWVPMGREEFRLCWDVILTSRTRGEMFRVFVDAQNGDVILRRGLTRYISDASYRVYTSDSPSPFSPGHSTPISSQPPLTNRVLVTLPAVSTNASPNGWINDGGNETTGNNVDAHTDRDNNNSPDLPRPVGSPFRVFDFAMNPATQDPDNYMSAAVVQLFYLCNWYHDKLYELGFTEAAGNFQINNFGRGGAGSDPVQADAQDGGGFNNANFSTPPDGLSGRMQMYIFSGPNPRRDGDFDAEIVFHEYTHGLSWRLVGGGQGLGTSQSDGMGEGWSDFYGLALLSEPGDDLTGCYAAGGFATYQLSGLAANYYFGIRRYPYSTDMTKNPLTFKDIDTQLASPHTGIPRSPIIGNSPNAVHNQGEVWCVTLWEARANLVNKYGWAVGNQLILQLVTDGMKLTPPTPNFLQARDAILQADLVNNGGANRGELWTAFARRGMGYSAISPPSTSNTGIVEAYDIPDDLFILPSLVLTSGGQVGGPFSPNPASFTLTNTGSNPLQWSLVSTSTWITVQPTSGTLTPGAVAANVNVTIGAVANTFPLGSYNATLAFTNHSSGISQTRTFRLSVVGGSLFDDFDPDIDLAQWSAFGGVVGSTVIANSSGGAVSPPNSLWFGDSGQRFATTVPIDASGGGTFIYWLRLGNSSSPWENVDLPGEGIVFEYSVNGGSTWTGIVTNNTSVFYTWTQVSNTIPVGARSNNTMFRWRQLNHSGSGFDHWALDDVTIDAGPASTLTVSITGDATEGDASFTGTVTAFPVPTSDLTVSLNSSDTSEATVPTSVIIPAGNASANFGIVIQDDTLLDGAQPVTITASATAHQSGNVVFTVNDNETAALSVVLPASASESSGSITGSVRVSTTPAANILVTLSSSDLSEIQVPLSVILPAGQTSAVFNMTVVNDSLIDGPQSAAVTAHVPNWTNGVGSITVLDNETVNLTVSLPVSAYENAGVLTGAGRVRLSGSLPTNLVVALSSSDLTEATVPVNTTVLAGQTNALFDITAKDDLLADGTRTVRIAAAAPGFNSGNNSMTIQDNESPPKPLNPNPPNLMSNVVANTSLSWSNGLSGVTNDVYFGTMPGAGQLQLLGSTTGSSWSLPLLAPNTTYYWRVIARRFGSSIGPLWQFTTRGVDHFAINPVPSPQYVNAPFSTTVMAKDEFGTTVSNFTGVVNLNGVAGGGFVTNKVLGDLPHASTGTGNYTLAFAITPSTNLTVTHVRSYSGTKVSVWSNAGGLLASQNVSGSPGMWTETLLNTPLQLLAGTTYRISFYTGNNTTYYYRSDRPSTFPHGTLVDGYYYDSGDAFPTLFYSSDKVIFLCDLRYTTAGATSIPVTPTVSGPFVNGAWTGNVSVSSQATSLVLRAQGGGHEGLSNPFDVLLQNDIAVAVTDTPDPVSVGGQLTYAVTVTNTGPAAASDVTVTNVLPTSAAIVSVSPSQGTVTTNGNVLTCHLESLAGNTFANVAVVVTINSTGSVTNHVTVTRSDADAYAPNNTAQTVTTVSSPVITVSDATMFEGNTGMGVAGFVVTVSPPPAAPVSVNFVTSAGTAAVGDYIHTNGTLNFAIGQTSKTIPVMIVGDLFHELDETFSLNLSGSVNATLGDNQAVGTIRNDDSMPTVSIGDVYRAEGNAGITNFVFPVTLSAASGLTVSVNYATANGNASSGADYVAWSGSLTIPPGDTSNSVVIAVNGDLQIESDEVFYVDLSAAANAILLKREGVGLIVNDDGLPGYVDHFAWSPMSPTQYVGAPFAATITALDVFDSPATNFNGTVSLSGWAGGGQTTNVVLGNLAHTSNGSGSWTLGYSFRPATNLTVTHVRSYFGSKVSIWTDAGVLLAAQNVSDSPGVWTETPLASPLVLNAGSTYRVAAFTGGGNYYYRQDGSNAFAHGTLVQSYQGSGDVFPTSSDSVRWWFADLVYTVGSSVVVPITPVISGTFVNGSWTGNITALTAATNFVLRAEDGQGHIGVSSSFTVELRNDLALSLTDMPDPVAVGANVSYLITVTNVGPAAATGVVVTNVLPVTALVGPVISSQGSSVTNGGIVVCNLGTLAGGGSATITIIARTTAQGAITNLATVSRAEPEAFLGNNTATVVTSVQLPLLSVNSVSISEGNSGSSPLVFTVSLSLPAVTNVSVNFTTANGSAQAGSDYVATNGTLNFAPGQTNRNFAVQVLGDVTSEPTETFSIQLSSATNAQLGTAVGTGTIVNDESSGIIAYFTDNSGPDTGWAAAITQAGFIPLLISNIATFNLTNIDMLLINEEDNGGISAALQARLPAIQTWVNNGGKLIVHDRSVGNLAVNPFLLGTTGTQSVRSPTADLDVIPPGTNLVVAGPHGVINNSNLDGGSHSAHGYVAMNQLPQGANAFISIGGSPNNVVCFSYPLGSGLIYYSGIPLDCYFTGSDCSGIAIAVTLQSIYSPNVLAYVSAQAGGGSFPPVIFSQPVSQTTITGGTATFSVTALGSSPLSYQWRKNLAPIAGATNASYVISNPQTNDAGNFSVMVTNPYGSVTSSVVSLTVIDVPITADFRISALQTNNSAVVDHDLLTGDDRGGIAASSSQVFYSGDNATAHFSPANLSGGAGIGQVYDGMVSDLRTEQMYHLANGTNLLVGAGTVTTLVELNGTTGLPTGNVIPLSTSINMVYGSGIFAGYGRIALHDGTRVHEVLLPSGQVVDRGVTAMPTHTYTENWAFWGVVENFGGSLYLVYVRDSQTIVRTHVPTGVTTNLASFVNLSDMACFTVSLTRNRWYFHYEGSGQFGGSSETIGYASATFSLVGSSNAPVILAEPVSQMITVGGSVTFSVAADGSGPLQYQWRRNGAVIVQATNNSYTISPVQYSSAGTYSVAVSNPYGSTDSTDAYLSVGAVTNLIVNAVDTGWYSPGGEHDPGNSNYFVGAFNSAEYRNWFVFNVPTFPGRVTAASLRVNTYGILTADGFETYQLRHVSTPVPTLVAGGSNLAFVYNDLGDGAVYGARDILVSEGYQFVTILLNAALLTNVTAATGQPFAIGGQITSLDGNLATDEYIFGASQALPADVQLLLTIGSNPSSLRFISSEASGGGVHFWLGTVDGSPITPDRAAGIRFYCSPDALQPVANWTTMTNSVVHTNNMLRLTVPGPLDASLFIRAQE